MKPHLQEAFAQDNRVEYLKYKERINAKNNRYYAKNKERILAKRKAIASKASVEELVVTPPPNLPSLCRPQHSVLLYTQNQDT
jgi:hypothetical protein